MLKDTERFLHDKGKKVSVPFDANAKLKNWEKFLMILLFLRL